MDTSGVQELAAELQRPEAEVLDLAVQTGLRQLRRARALARYLRGEISRGEAIESVGVDWVDLAERQNEAMRQDLVEAANYEFGQGDKPYPPDTQLLVALDGTSFSRSGR